MNSQHSPWGNNPHDYLDSHDEEYKPQQPVRMGVDSLPNGDHDCTISSAALDSTKNGKHVARLQLRTSLGHQIEHVYWIDQTTELNKLGADLLALGFDADRWGQRHGRPLSVEIPKALAALQGVRCRVNKSTSEGTQQGFGQPPKVFHNLRVLCRLGQSQPAPMPPAQNKPWDATQSAPPVQVQQEEEIPF